MMSIPKKLLLSLISLLLFSQTAWTQEIIPIERAVEIALLNNPDFGFPVPRLISRDQYSGRQKPLFIPSSRKTRNSVCGKGIRLLRRSDDMGLRKDKSKGKSKETLPRIRRTFATGSKTMLVRDTRIAYYHALSGKNRLQGAATETQRRKWLLEKTEELFAVGKKSAQQLSQAEIDLQQAKLELVSRENSYELAMLNLRHLMNDPSLGQFDIRENLVYEKVNETREDLVRFALSKTPK